MFTVYILYSQSSKKTYVGFTSNLEERFKSHNELSIKGWTIKYRPWEIIYKEEFPSKELAMAREKEPKSGKGSDFIKSLVKSL
jgi:putative endonuclease